MMRGVSSLTIAASGGTAQAASSQTGKPGQTGDGKPGQTGANRGQCQTTPFPKGPEPPLASTGKPGTKPETRGKTGDQTGQTGDSAKLPRFRKGQSRRLLQRATRSEERRVG